MKPAHDSDVSQQSGASPCKCPGEEEEVSPSGGLYEMLIAAMSLSLLQGRTLIARKSSALIFSKGAHMYYVWHRKCFTEKELQKGQVPTLCQKGIFFYSSANSWPKYAIWRSSLLAAPWGFFRKGHVTTAAACVVVGYSVWSRLMVEQNSNQPPEKCGHRG